MITALLIDLDDTLLGNPMETFIPAYFEALAEWTADRIPPQKLIADLLTATEVMAANDGSELTNEQVFAAEFYPLLGCDRDDLEPVFEQFYVERFPALVRHTTRRLEARRLVDWARQKGVEVAIATNPLFPAIAIEERLRWAGLPPAEVSPTLVTTYENMHATKSSPAYYREILDRLDRPADECLMVGDNWDWDVVQPAAVGIRSYWIAEPGTALPDPRTTPVGIGSLADFEVWIRDFTANECPEREPR